HYGKEGKKKQSAQQATTASVNVPSGYSQNDINLMANAVHGEARGEPYEGQVAVAAVILNRVESSTFPNNVAGVIFEPRARSEEHTSELQSRFDLVCRLLLEKKNITTN